METENPSNSAAVIETVERLAQVEQFLLAGQGDSEIRVLAVPQGKQLVSIKKYIDEYRQAPERMRGTARLTTLESFVGHVNRFKDLDSAIFADVTSSSPRLIGVLDYNEGNDFSPDAQDPGAGRPRFGEHRAEYVFPLSKEWQAWSAAAKAPMKHAQFAEFLEERLPDVLEGGGAGEVVNKLAGTLGIELATPQRLLELSRGLSVKVGHAVISHHNLSSGEAQISFKEEHSDDKGQPLRVPGGFAIAIPVFHGGVAYRLAVRLRYRVKDAEVTWLVGVQRADKAFEDAVNGACADAHAKTELPLFFGTPEA